MAGRASRRNPRNAEFNNPFEVAINGVSAAGDSALPRTYAAAGATWWLECLFGLRGSVEEILRRVEAGPPR